MHKYQIALRIYGDNLEPSAITEQLRITPTQTRTRGTQITKKKKWSKSMWEYVASPKKRGTPLWSDFEEGLNALLEVLELHELEVRHLAGNFDAEVYCGHFHTGFDGGPRLSPQLLQRLGKFGIPLFLDTYCSRKRSSG